MAVIMKWGFDDCLTDLFGDDAHQKISWLKETHNDTLLFVMSLTEEDRLKLFRATFLGQGYTRVENAEPGDAAIGDFKLGINHRLILPPPWFAQMGVDYLWYARMPSGIRVANYEGEIEVYRCPFSQ